MYNYAYIYNITIIYTRNICILCIYNYIYICRMLYICTYSIYISMAVMSLAYLAFAVPGFEEGKGDGDGLHSRSVFIASKCCCKNPLRKAGGCHGEPLLRGISLGKTHRCMRQNAIAWQENDWNMLDVPGFSTPQIPWFLIFFSPSNCYKSWVSPCSDPPTLSSVPNVNLAVSTGEKNRTRQGSSWRRWRWTCWRRAVEIAAIFSEVTCWR